VENPFYIICIQSEVIKMSLQRQTYLVVGVIVLLGVILGFFISPWWLLLPTLMGVGMLVAAILGFCNMTRLLSKLPWNEPHSGKI